MILQCQESALSMLDLLARSNHHSILISGPSGCGKTYLAKQYADKLNISDFIPVKAAVSDIRTALDEIIGIDHPIALCIENLDTGMKAASYAVLKTLEDPTSNIYIIITARNIKMVPDTILSRSASVLVSPPRLEDLRSYGEYLDSVKFKILGNNKLWKYLRSFDDVNIFFNMTGEQQEYIENYPSILASKKPISTIQWSMSHYDDNTELPVDIALRYLLDVSKSRKDAHVYTQCLECLNTRNEGKIAKHAALSKFILECKYGGG